jgi:hypothetical protein
MGRARRKKKCPEVGSFGVAQSPKSPSHGTLLFITGPNRLAREKKEKFLKNHPSKLLTA